MKISKRVSKIINSINVVKNTTYYDIGCDHGIIGYQLLKTFATIKVVFCDISAHNLNKARQLCLSDSTLINRCEFINCDGVPQNAKLGNIGLIFGLGGESIIEILQKNNQIEEFYLQPVTSTIALRKYLSQNGYHIIVDVLLFDGKKYYDFIHIIKTSQNEELSIDELIWGKSNIYRMDEEFTNYLKKEKNNLEKVLAMIDIDMLEYKNNVEKFDILKTKYDKILQLLEGVNNE